MSENVSANDRLIETQMRSLDHLEDQRLSEQEMSSSNKVFIDLLDLYAHTLEKTPNHVSRLCDLRNALISAFMSRVAQPVEQEMANSPYAGSTPVTRQPPEPSACAKCRELESALIAEQEHVELLRAQVPPSDRLRAALQMIIDEGDYTNPEGMKRIAREALAPATKEESQ